MNSRPDVLVIIPQGLPDIAAHHEATVGMGALDPAPVPFLYPPHVAAQCVANLRAAGLSAAVLDPWGSRRTLAGALAEIGSSPASVLAVQVSHGTEHADETFLRLLRRATPRRSRRHVLLFGPAAHFVAGFWLEAELADAVLLGEPEGAIASAVRAVVTGKSTGMLAAHELCPDCYTPDNLVSDLDILPFPAWDSVPWQAYEGMVSLLSGRGCPDRCAYCAYIVAQGRRFRTQSVTRTLAEWEWLAREVRPGYLMVRDPVFARDRARLVALCEGIIARGVALRWGCESRPEHFDPELLALMRAAGCEDLKIGLESSDPDLLARLGRVQDAAAADAYLRQVEMVAKACQRLGIICRVFVVAGLPGHDTRSVARTAGFLRRLGSHVVVHALPYQAHPGTSLPGPSASVPPGTLALLQAAPRAGGMFWQQAWHRARGATTSALRGLQSGLRQIGPRGSGRRRSSAPMTAVNAPKGQAVLNETPIPDAVSAFAGVRVFLTGGNGFVGGHVAAALAAAGATVVALVRPGSGLGALADLPAERVEIVRGDLVSGPNDWLAALAGCRYCFHLAALYAGSEQAAQMYDVNVRGANRLLAACAEAGVGRVVHTSTVGCVGRPDNPAALPDESARFNLWNSASHYVRSKYLGELVARAWAMAGFPVVIVQPTAPVGPGDTRPTATGARIMAALRGEVYPYPPGGVNHVPVQDVAAGHLLAALRGIPGERYILGHVEGNLDQAAFLHLVAQAASRPPLVAPKAGRDPGLLPPALTVNPLRAVRELGMPQSDLQEAFVAAVTWFQTHR